MKELDMHDHIGSTGLPNGQQDTVIKQESYGDKQESLLQILSAAML